MILHLVSEEFKDATSSSSKGRGRDFEEDTPKPPNSKRPRIDLDSDSNATCNQIVYSVNTPDDKKQTQMTGGNISNQKFIFLPIKVSIF